MTGQRKIVQIANRLGKVLDIEKAYPQKTQKTLESSEHSILPLKPATTSDSVATFFWRDNFDKVYYWIKKKLPKTLPFAFSETLEKDIKSVQS